MNNTINPIQKKINNNRDRIQAILQSDDYDPKDKYEFIKELARRNDKLIIELNKE